MFDKFKTLLKSATENLKGKLYSMQAPIKAVTVCYFLLVVLLVLTYYIAWLYQCSNGHVVMNDLLAVIQEMIGPTMIGFITFIAGCFVDTNNNGIPDTLEEENNHDEKGNLRHYPKPGERR